MQVTVPVADGAFGVAVDATTLPSTLYVAGGGSNSVSVIQSHRVIQTITSGLIGGPIEVALDPQLHEVFVTEKDANRVAVIWGGQVVKTILTGVQPVGIAVDPIHHLAYIANTASNSISVIDTVALTTKATLQVGTSVAQVAFEPVTKKVYVSEPDAGALQVIVGDRLEEIITLSDAQNRERPPTAHTGARRAFSVTADPKTQTVYASNGEGIAVIRGDNVIGSIPVPDEVWGLAVHPMTQTLYAVTGSDTVLGVNPDLPTERVSLPVPEGTGRITMDEHSGEMVTTSYFGYVTFTRLPGVSSMSRSGGSVAQGTTLTINGLNLDVVQAVFFGDTAHPATTDASTATSLRLTLPAHPAGNVNLSFSTALGAIPLTGQQYLFADIRPTDGLDTDSTLISVHGGGFAGVTRVTLSVNPLDPRPASGITVVNDSTLSFTAPPWKGYAGSATISIFSPRHTFVIPDAFTYYTTVRYFASSYDLLPQEGGTISPFTCPSNRPYLANRQQTGSTLLLMPGVYTVRSDTTDTSVWLGKDAAVRNSDGWIVGWSEVQNGFINRSLIQVNWISLFAYCTDNVTEAYK